jgi:hypothetical protein
VAVPGFQESSTVAGILDPKRRDAVFAPYLRYSFPGPLIRVPAVFTADSVPYLESSVVPKLEQQHEFLLVGLSGMETFEDWFMGRLGATFKERIVGYYGGIKVVVFERIP